MAYRFKKGKKVFLLLWGLCVLGLWSVIPYVVIIQVVPPNISLAKLFALITAQGIFFFGLILQLSYLILPKTDLSPFLSHKPLKRIVYPGLIFGFLVALVLTVFELTLFKNASLLHANLPPAWAGLIASFYGAINEEVLVRLFLFTLIYFVLNKIFKFSQKNRLTFLWITNIFVALCFGLGHLPAAFRIGASSSVEIMRILFLNGFASLVFGWLYWSHGLWSAMAAHFVTDIIIHAIMV